MRKTLLILGLVGLTVLAGASEAFAQRRGGGGGGGRGGYGGGRGGYGGGRGYGSGMYNYGGRGGYYPGYGFGGFGFSPYFQNYGDAYDVAPSYYYEEPAYAAPTMRIRQSYYPAPVTAQQSVRMTVFVPAAAQVWFDGNATRQQGTERVFESPALEPGHNFTYTIKARWLENGQTVNQERPITVQAGQSVTVDFRASAGETVPPPLPKLPNPIPRD